MKQLTDFQHICQLSLYQVDKLRHRLGRYPKTIRGAAAMGFRSGLFLRKGNPYLGSKVVLGYSAIFIIDYPVKVWDMVSDYSFGRGISPLARAFQMARNQAIWDYHLNK